MCPPEFIRITPVILVLLLLACLFWVFFPFQKFSFGVLQRQIKQHRALYCIYSKQHAFEMLFLILIQIKKQRIDEWDTYSAMLAKIKDQKVRSQTGLMSSMVIDRSITERSIKCSLKLHQVMPFKCIFSVTLQKIKLKNCQQSFREYYRRHKIVKGQRIRDFTVRLSTINVRSYNHKVSPTRLLKHELSKDDISRHAKVGKAHKASTPHKRFDKLLRNAQSERNSLPQDGARWVGSQGQPIIPEDMHLSHGNID